MIKGSYIVWGPLPLFFDDYMMLIWLHQKYDDDDVDDDDDEDDDDEDNDDDDDNDEKDDKDDAV